MGVTSLFASIRSVDVNCIVISLFRMRSVECFGGAFFLVTELKAIDISVTQRLQHLIEKQTYYHAYGLFGLYKTHLSRLLTFRTT